MIARVVVDLSLDRTFDYRVPPELERAVTTGTRVVVPFGPREANGFVVGLVGRSDQRELKAIHGLAGRGPYLDRQILELARWVGDYYCATLEQAVRTVLPGSVRRPNARFKERSFVSPVPLDAAPEGAETGLTPKQKAVLALVSRDGALPLSDVKKRAGVSDAPIKALAGKGLVAIGPGRVRRRPGAERNILRTKPLALMPEQAQALAAIRERLRPVGEAAAPAVAGQGTTGGVLLLYGVTGSGKTEVYLQAIDEVLARGQGAIVLVPEISLTPQTVERFTGRFGPRIAVLHSHLSDGERHDEWYRIRDGEADVVVGARSAVFAPVRNLGLIAVDEEHETSYKQGEAPRYNARDVAVMRGHRQGCPVVLGSATPCLESWHNARRGKYALAVLPRRADHRTMPAVRVVDMRIETQRAGRPSLFSRELLDAMRLRLERAEQTILFLNRRGYATSLVCPSCGFVAVCDQCSVSCTYHRTDERLRCHICGDSRAVPKHCPECKDPAFRFAGVGTQRVEKVVGKCFPQARVQRMDTDVTVRKDAYDRILGDFRVGKIDVLIGTQMIAKGLHFPNVTLVGVVYADLSLHLPDFRAGERTFQLLAQVAGRAGRGEVAGEVIVQTYTPFHVAVQAARRLDYEGFCDQELAFRKELSYPPFGHVICLNLRGRSEEKVSYCTGVLAGRLRKALEGRARVSEGSPAPLAKARGEFRYQVMLRTRSVGAAGREVRRQIAELKLPPEVKCAVDVDPLSLL